MKPARFTDLDSERRRSLEQRQLLFQQITRRLFDFAEQDLQLKNEILPASDHFFHGRNPLPHVHNEQDLKLAFGRFLEWFAYERPSRSYRQPPIDVFVAQLPDGEERRAAEQLKHNVLDSFAVRAIAPGCGLTLQSLTTQRVFDVFEHSASKDLVCGAVLMGRLFRLDERFWTLSGAILSLNDARAAEHLARDLSRIDPEERRVRSQRDYEAALMGETRRPVTSEEKRQVPAELIETRLRELLAEARIDVDIAAVRQRMTRARYPLDVLNGLLKQGRFVNEEQLQEMLDVLVQLWNTTPRPELDGRTPREVSRLAPMGPLERRLAAEFAESLRREKEAEVFDTNRRRRHAAIAARQREWMSTPREDLGGLTPADVITAERAHSMDRALPPGDAPSVYKVSRNAPCPCGSGKRYKRCCLLKQH